ncbi:MAG: leucine-rich repeat protein, partial [Kiritimatiellae bacterium]|nr:leucine-rich repeat protein [Kiritimatiellia bacterium]
MTGNLVIPNSVTNIGDRAFCGCSGFTGDLNLPSGVNYIGSSAFSGCRGLNGSLAIPDGVMNIGDWAFANCLNLRGPLSFPNCVTNIGEYAFYCCSNLVGEVIIPAGVTSIPQGAFGHCRKITKVIIMDGVQSISAFAFSICTSLTYVLIPDSVVSIEENALPAQRRLCISKNYSGNLSTGNSAYPAWPVIRYDPIHTVFFDLSGGDGMIDSVNVKVAAKYGTLPSDVWKAGYSFVGWGLGGERISEDSIVTNLQDHVLVAQWSPLVYEVGFNLAGGTDVSGILNVTFDAIYGELPTPSRLGYSFDGWIINGEKITSETLVSTPSNHVLTASWLPNKYPMVFNANGGLGGCTLMQDYDTPVAAPVVSRAGYSFTGWSPSILTNVPAESLEFVAQWDVNSYEVSFDLNGGIGELGSVELIYDSNYGELPVPERDDHTFLAWALYGNMVDADTILTTASNHVLTAIWRRWKTSLSDSAIGGKTLKKLYPKDYAYLTDVVLEEEVTRLADSFFDGCNEIVRLTLPSTLTSIGYDDLPPKIKESLAYDTDGFMIYQGWLLGYRDKEAASLTVPEGVIGIGSCALAEMYDLETVNLPQSLKYIAGGAFREDTYLDNLVIPDGVEIIGDGAFEDCSFIQTMTLGNGIKSVGARAFAGCTQLSGVVFGEGLVEIGAESFDGCWRMLSVSLPLSVTNVVSTAFRGCTSLTGVAIPTHGGRVSNWFAPIYSQIRDVTLLEDELDICVGMFKGCSSLMSIHLPDSVTNIAAQAFYGCSSLTEVRLPESLSTLGSEAFRNCSSLTAAALPENVTSIGSRAFQGCSNLSALTLPRGLGALPDYVFAGCSSLDSFVVPAAVTNLGNYIVSGSTTAIYYLGNAPAYGANVYGNASGSLKSYVILGTKGWDGRPNSRDIPASWNGRDILTWSANQFDVTFDANGGLFSLDATDTYICEETTYTGYVLPPVDPVRAGMDFDGYWTAQSGGTRIFTSTRVLLTKSHMLYAHWIANTSMKLTLKPNSTTRGSVSGGGEYMVGATATLKAAAKTGNAFAGWFTDKACTKPLNPKGYDNRNPTVKIVVPENDTTIYAKFVTKGDDKAALKFDAATKKLATTPAKATAGTKFSLSIGAS